MSASVPTASDAGATGDGSLLHGQSNLNPPVPHSRHPWRRWGARLLALTLLAGMALAGAWLWTWHRDRRTCQDIDAAISRFDLDTADSLLQQFRQSHPQDPKACFLAARTARRLGRIADAEQLLELSQQLGGVTDATLLEWDLLRVQQGRMEGIDVRLRRSIQPDHPDALLVLEALARGYLTIERLKDGRQACELWLERQPDHPLALLWRGWVFERLHHLEKAHADFERAVEQAPHLTEARIALGNLLMTLRRPQDAVEHFEHVVERNPNHGDALLGLAACRVATGDGAVAVPLLDRYLAARPEEPRGLLVRGRAAIETGKFAEAESYLRRTVTAAPDDVEALQLLVHCLRTLHKNEEADRWWRRVDPLWSELRRLDKLTKQIAMHPDEAALWHEAGTISMRLGRPDKALVWFEGALRGNGDHRPTHLLLAEHYEKQGDPGRAEHHRRAARDPRAFEP